MLLKGKASFKTISLDLIVTLPYFRNTLVKKLTMPQSKVIDLDIIPIRGLRRAGSVRMARIIPVPAGTGIPGLYSMNPGAGRDPGT